MLTSLYDKNKLRVNYNQSLQKSALNVSLMLANANRKKRLVGD